MDAKVDARELTALLERFRARGLRLSPTMAEVAEMLVGRVQEEWDTAGHGSWPPLAESTLRSRRGTTAQILVDTGRAAASVQADHGEDFAEAATDVSYMVYHASKAPRKVIPYRNPFDIPDDALEEAADIIVGDIMRGLQ